MLIKRYEAPTIREALAQVKLELGETAVILGTRTLRKKSKFMGMGSESRVEVTAAADPTYDEVRNLPPSPVLAKPVLRATPIGRPRPAPWDPRKEESGVRNPLKPIPPKMPEPVLPIGEDRTDEPGWNEVSSHVRVESDPVPSLSLDSMRREIQELKSMAGFLFHRLGSEMRDRLPEEFRFLHVGLTRAGMGDESAFRLLDLVKERFGESRFPSWETLMPLLRQTLAESALIYGPIRVEPGRVKIASFIGPTGVGKTTTVAKLAAHFSMLGHRVALMTIDTYRIAAVEQISVYSRLLQVPLEVIRRPEEIRPALDRRQDRDLILLDTAGRSQRDAEKIRELVETLNRVEEAEHHLVLPATADPRVMEETIRGFGELPLESLVFTKLDEAIGTGPLYTQSMKYGIPISYLAVGQKVPEDIEPASGAELARRILEQGFPQDRPGLSSNHNPT